MYRGLWSLVSGTHKPYYLCPSSEVCCSLFVLSDYYLPKDEVEFYQFCYVDSSGQVRGASTPFSFRSQEEQSLECSPDDELLVITTQVPKADGRFGVKASDCDSEIKR